MNPEDEKEGLLRRLFGAGRSAWNKARSNVISDIALGLTPAGVVADVQDFAKGIAERSPSGVAMASLGFIPGVGDAAKNLAKLARRRDLIERIPSAVLEAPSPGTVGVGDVLAGRLSEEGLSGQALRRTRGAPEYAGRRYESAINKGLSLEPEDIAKRRAEFTSFDQPVYHGAMTERSLGNLLGANVKTARELGVANRPLFTGIGESGLDLSSGYAQMGGGVVPLAVNPGKIFEIDAGGRVWNDLDLDQVVGELVRSGKYTDDEILDIIEEGYLSANALGPEFTDYVRRTLEPDYDPLGEMFMGTAPLSTDDVAKIARSAGYDSSVIRNIVDPIDAPELYDPDAVALASAMRPSDIMIINEPAGRIRHWNAVFDPAARRSRNIFAGTAGAMLGGSALTRALSGGEDERYY